MLCRPLSWNRFSTEFNINAVCWRVCKHAPVALASVIPRQVTKQAPGSKHAPVSKLEYPKWIYSEIGGPIMR